MATVFTIACPSCFKDKGRLTVAVCPHCGYSEDEPRSPAALPLRTVLGDRYLVGRLLGKLGGFGMTYLGWDRTQQRVVAVKEYFPRAWVVRSADTKTVVPYSENEEKLFLYWLDELGREAATLARFDHDNVVRVSDFFKENGTGYLVMDYYEGISLEEYLARRGAPLSEQEALGIIRSVLGGLGEVHDKGFIHRDIKPHNIHLTTGGRVILLDFGAARYAAGDESRSLSVILTPGFAPFEQYQRKGKQGPWTDLYACGALLYRMVTGEKPADALEREKGDTLVPPEQRVPSLSPQFRAAIMKCLAKEPAQRPQSVAELLKLLGGLSDAARRQGDGDQTLKGSVLLIMMEKQQAALPAAGRQEPRDNGATVTSPLHAPAHKKAAGAPAAQKPPAPHPKPPPKPPPKSIDAPPAYMPPPEQLMKFVLKEEVCRNVLRCHARVLVNGWRGTGKTTTVIKASAVFGNVRYYNARGRSLAGPLGKNHSDMEVLATFDDVAAGLGRPGFFIIDSVDGLTAADRQRLLALMAKLPPKVKLVLVSSVVTEAREFLKHIDAVIKMKLDTAELAFTALCNLDAL